MAHAAAAAAGVRNASRRMSGNNRLSSHWAVCSRQIPVRKRVKGWEARELQEKKKKEQAFAKKVLDAYDEDCSGCLDIEELRYCLRDYASQVCKVEKVPSQDDLDFLLFLCTEDMRATSFEVNDLVKAMQLWDDMLTYSPRIKKLMKRRDQNGDGAIDRRELALFMLEINDGSPVDPETLDWIMQMGDLEGDGALEPDELTRAIAAWYGHVEDNSAKGGEERSSRSCAIL